MGQYSHDLTGHPATRREGNPAAMSDFQEHVEKLNVRGIIMASLMTAFGLVVALAWKDAINALVASIIPDSDNGSLLSMFITAVAVTVLVTVLAATALKTNKRLEQSWDRVNDLWEKDEDEGEPQEKADRAS